MLAVVLAFSQGLALAQTEVQPKSDLDEGVALQTDPRLGTLISEDLSRRSMRSILQYLQEKTKVTLDIGTGFDGEEKAWETLYLHRVPAWRVMKQLTETKSINNGRWGKTDQGYVFRGERSATFVVAKPRPAANPAPPVADPPSSDRNSYTVVLVWLVSGVLLITMTWILRKRFRGQSTG